LSEWGRKYADDCKCGSRVDARISDEEIEGDGYIVGVVTRRFHGVRIGFGLVYPDLNTRNSEMRGRTERIL
jgi:hypothetical protein